MPSCTSLTFALFFRRCTSEAQVKGVVTCTPHCPASSECSSADPQRVDIVNLGFAAAVFPILLIPKSLAERTLPV